VPRTFYIIADGNDATNPPITDADRALSLNADLCIGDPTGLVTVYPSVAIISSSISPVIIPDDQGQATLEAVQDAQQAATTAESAEVTSIKQATQNLKTLVTQLQPALIQGQADLATLSGSTDPKDQISLRTLQGVMTLAQGVNDILIALNIISGN